MLWCGGFPSQHHRRTTANPRSPPHSVATLPLRSRWYHQPASLSGSSPSGFYNYLLSECDHSKERSFYFVMPFSAEVSEHRRPVIAFAAPSYPPSGPPNIRAGRPCHRAAPNLPPLDGHPFSSKSNRPPPDPACSVQHGVSRLGCAGAYLPSRRPALCRRKPGQLYVRQRPWLGMSVRCRLCRWHLVSQDG